MGNPNLAGFIQDVAQLERKLISAAAHLRVKMEEVQRMVAPYVELAQEAQLHFRKEAEPLAQFALACQEVVEPFALLSAHFVRNLQGVAERMKEIEQLHIKSMEHLPHEAYWFR